MSDAYLGLNDPLNEIIEMTNMTFTPTGTAGDATSGNDVAARVERLKNITDDKVMLRAVAELTRDLGTANPRIFWSDFLFSALLGYAGLAVAILASPLWLKLGAGFISVLALYRAGGFIHEVSHMKHSSVPGFRFGFNAMIGVPLLVPSYMYEGVHNLHHARTRYGTDQDPEYLPLALMKPWTLPVFILVSVFAPFALLFRNAILAQAGGGKVLRPCHQP
jgi:fatty acid desaturase